MKFHNNSFGKRQKKTVFLSFIAAAAVLQFSSCAELSQISDLPAVIEGTSDSATEMFLESTEKTNLQTEEAITQISQTQGTESSAETTVQTKPEEQTTAETTVPVRDETEETTPVLREERTEMCIEEPYETVYEYSYDYKKGERFTKQKGVVGETKIITVMTYEGEDVVDIFTQTETVTEKRDEIIVIGIRSVITEKTVTMRGEEIPFETVYIYDDTRYDDEMHVITEGRNGYTSFTYLITYEDSKEIARELISESFSAPLSKEIVIGTKPAYTVETEAVKGNIVSYSTIYEYDDTLDVGVRKMKNAGADGYTEYTYQITYYKGTENTKELISEKKYEPINEVILIGTKKEESFYMPFLDAAHGGYDYVVTQSFSSTHRALDFGVWYGEPICAIKSGTVITAYNEGYFSKDNILWTYGTYVVIEHADGMRSYYAHLKSKTVSVGQKVSGGQIIGYSGNTGRVNPSPTADNPLAGTHLHFEIRILQNGAYVTTDPRKYLPYWN